MWVANIPTHLTNYTLHCHQLIPVFSLIASNDGSTCICLTCWHVHKINIVKRERISQHSSRTRTARLPTVTHIRCGRGTGGEDVYSSPEGPYPGQGSHFFHLIKFPDFSLTFPWFPKIFPWFFLSFYQDILVQKSIYLFFLSVALVTLVYANIASLSAISWQLLKEGFYSLRKHFSSD